jgi:MarR family transcriptional regulator, 2-MHQ and catechol-resistance regulon repressor
MAPDIDTSAGARPAPSLDDPLLTTLGLFFEAHAGLALVLERHLEAECAMSLQWFEVLLRLARSPGNRLRMSDLAAQTTLSTSGLTRAVDRLESAGLVRREACDSDRRGAFAALTASGAERIDAAVPVHLAQAHDLLDRTLPGDRLETFTDLLRHLRDALNPAAAEASVIADPDG